MLYVIAPSMCIPQGLLNLRLCVRKPTIWVSDQVRHKRAWHVQSQEQARTLKFRIKEEELLHYLWSENKGADQLCSYCTADLRLCFRICRLLVFLFSGSFITLHVVRHAHDTLKFSTLHYHGNRFQTLHFHTAKWIIFDYYDCM